MMYAMVCKQFRKEEERFRLVLLIFTDLFCYGYDLLC